MPDLSGEESRRPGRTGPCSGAGQNPKELFGGKEVCLTLTTTLLGSRRRVVHAKKAWGLIPVGYVSCLP